MHTNKHSQTFQKANEKGGRGKGEEKKRKEEKRIGEERRKKRRRREEEEKKKRRRDYLARSFREG